MKCTRRTSEDTVQCFPLYPILLSLGNPTVDLFSLDVEGSEMGVIETVPWDKVDIRWDIAIIRYQF